MSKHGHKRQHTSHVHLNKYANRSRAEKVAAQLELESHRKTQILEEAQERMEAQRNSTSYGGYMPSQLISRQTENILYRRRSQDDNDWSFFLRSVEL